MNPVEFTVPGVAGRFRVNAAGGVEVNQNGAWVAVNTGTLAPQARAAVQGAAQTALTQSAGVNPTPGQPAAQPAAPAAPANPVRTPYIAPPPASASAAIQSASRAAQAAETNLINARQRYDNAAAQYDTHVNLNQNVDPLVVNAITGTFNEAQAALAKAEEDWASANRNLASAYAAEPGNEAQATYYAAQAELAKAQADALKAKTPQERAESQAAIAKAQAEAARISAEISTLIPAQAANLQAQSAEAGARIASGLFQAQAAAQQGQAQLAGAQAGQVRAETEQLLPANVRNILAQAGYTEAQIRQIQQNMRRPAQITQGLDQPNLLWQDPQSGQVSATPNPNDPGRANIRLIQNEYDALDTIQGMIEKRQMSPQEGQVYMDAIRRQTQAALSGTTPWQQTLERNRYTEAGGRIGADILNNRVANANSLASNIMSGLSQGAMNMTRPFDFAGLNPFAMAGGFVNQMGGGQGVADTATSLVQGLRNMGADGLPNFPPGTMVVNLPYGPQGGPAPGPAAAAAAPAPAQAGPWVLPPNRQRAGGIQWG
jgi:hypothetical protein